MRVRYCFQPAGVVVYQGHCRSVDMDIHLNVLLLFSPLIFFVGCVLVVAAEQWWQGRGRLKR